MRNKILPMHSRYFFLSKDGNLSGYGGTSCAYKVMEWDAVNMKFPKHLEANKYPHHAQILQRLEGVRILNQAWQIDRF